MAYADEVLADTPWLYWKLNETSGTSAADSGPDGTRTGTYVDTPTLNQASLVPSDLTGKSVSFNATSEWVLSDVMLNTANVTVECWFEHDGVACVAGQDWHIVGFADGESSGTHDKNIGINDANQAVFYAFSGGPKFTTGATTLGAATYHLVGVANSTDIRIYVNGVLDGTPTACGATFTGYSVNNILVAGRPATTGVFSQRIAGRRDEFAVYTSALSADRILAHYNASLVAAAAAARREYLMLRGVG